MERMSMLDGGDMVQIRTSTVQPIRAEVYAALQYAAIFQCSVEEWRDCEELEPKPNNWFFHKKQWKVRIIARSGVRPQADILA